MKVGLAQYGYGTFIEEDVIEGDFIAGSPLKYLLRLVIDNLSII